MPTAEELRKQVIELAGHLKNVPVQEIVDMYDISETYAAILRTASKHIKLLLDSGTTLEQKAERLGVKKSTVASYLSVLRKIGVEIKKICGGDGNGE